MAKLRLGLGGDDGVSATRAVHEHLQLGENPTRVVGDHVGDLPPHLHALSIRAHPRPALAPETREAVALDCRCLSQEMFLTTRDRSHVR